MSREYEIQANELPLSYRGTLKQPAIRGVYLEELPDSVSDTSEISSERYSIIEDDLMNVGEISDTSCPFTHSYAAYIYVGEAGTYSFYVRANFGAEATIYDGERGVSTGVTCGVQAESSSAEEITFAEPGYYKVEVKYYSTGEASPVLELHFGKKSSDSASREELPQLRNYFILSYSYIALPGNGTVLRLGEEYQISLHSNNNSQTITGGTVFVKYDEYSDPVVIKQFNGSSVQIPVQSIDNAESFPRDGYPIRIRVNISTPNRKGEGTTRWGGCDYVDSRSIFGTILPENFREHSDKSCACGCSNPTETENDCISFRQNIGRTPWVAGAPVGQLFIEEDKPSAAMLTPAVLKYRHVICRKMLNTETAYMTGHADISDGCGQIISYDLATGRATGLTVTEDSMLMSSGSEWVEQFADRSQVVYDSAGQMVRYVTSGGIVLGPKDFGIDIVGPRDSDGKWIGPIQQIYSIADGLMNVTSVTSAGSSGSFRIDWYSPNAVLSAVVNEEETIEYVVSSGANPVKSFLFSGTYQPALNGQDLRFHLTESRYGGTQTYYTGWEYSEDYDSSSSSMNYQGWAMYKGNTPNSIQQTELRMITSGEYSSKNFHVSNVIVSGSCSLADYISSGGVALYERNAEVNCGGLGNSRTHEVIGSDTSALPTESRTRVSSGNGVGKTACYTDRYDKTTSYTYDSMSRISTMNTNESYGTCHVSYTYPTSSSGSFTDYRPTVIVSAYENNGSSMLFNQTTYSYGDNVASGRSETIVRSANGSALTTKRVWYPVSAAVVSGGTRTTTLNYSEGRLKTVRNEDGTMTSYSYGAVAVSGMPSSGTIFTESATEGYSPLSGVFATLPGKSVRRVNSYNVCGDLVGQERFVCLSNGAFVSIGSDSFQYNLTHQRTSARYANEATTSANWNCTGPTTEVNVDGVTTTYQYDGLKRCIGKVTSSPNGTITESYTLDHAGNIVQTTVSGGGLSLSSSAAYDQEGRIISAIDFTGQTTSWEYSEDDRRATLKIYPDGSELATYFTPEGEFCSSTGTAELNIHIQFGISSDGYKIKTADNGLGIFRKRAYIDGHGHVVKEKEKSYPEASHFYDTLGRHISTYTPGQPSLSKTYDVMGNPLAEILSGGTSIRTTLTNTFFVSSASAVYQIAVTSVFASNTASGTSTTPLVTSKVTRLYPFLYGMRTHEIDVDSRGNSTTIMEYYDSALQTRTTVLSSTGISNMESAVQRDGLLFSSVSILGGTTSYAYDGLHRQVAQTDPFGNVTSQIYNAYGQVASVIDSTGAVTTYAYDNMGRVTQMVNALGGTVSYTYNLRGQKLSESGNATYPVEYEYDEDEGTGKLIKHTLHRNAGIDDSSCYSYDPYSLLLREKVDACGNSTCYEYNSNGLLTKRTWARTTSNGADLITSYTYNDFGELTSISYSDSTPNVEITRDALGREIARSDGAGIHTTFYNTYGEVISEGFPLAANSSAIISRTYDSFGRQNSILLGGVTVATYAYDADTGRYTTVGNNSATITYSYLDKTNLPVSQTWKIGSNTPFLTVSNTYDAYNRLTLIKANSSNQAAYVYDSLGRRTSATLQDGSKWNYAYNLRSELTNAVRRTSNNIMMESMCYAFDEIGNRTSSRENATSKTYDANSLNQYTEIDVTGGSSVCPLYDDDGNMTQFDSSTYTYDAENRLVGAQNGTTRLEFIYDALGRRVAKKTYQNNTLAKHQRFIYNGLKLLRICDAYYSYGFIPTFTFLWQSFGPDVPLAMWKHSDNTLFAYLVDANKNVLGLYVPSGTRVATYLYGPFGQKLSESGNAAPSNPLQFSSEQFDADLGLVYYNFRYYFPNIGKWLTKDPIGEMGGWNLYAFCRNNAVNTWDRWGLEVSVEKEDSDNCFTVHFYYNSERNTKKWFDRLDIFDWADHEDNNYLSHVAISTTGIHKEPVGFYPKYTEDIWEGFKIPFRMGFGGEVKTEHRDDLIVSYTCCCVEKEKIDEIDKYLSFWLNKSQENNTFFHGLNYNEHDWRVNTNNCATFVYNAIKDISVNGNEKVKPFWDLQWFGVLGKAHRPEELRKALKKAGCREEENVELIRRELIRQELKYDENDEFRIMLRNLSLLLMLILLPLFIGCRHDVFNSNGEWISVPISPISIEPALLPWGEEEVTTYGLAVGLGSANIDSYGIFTQLGNDFVGKNYGLTCGLVNGFTEPHLDADWSRSYRGDRTEFYGIAVGVLTLPDFYLRKGFGTQNGISTHAIDFMSDTNGISLEAIGGQKYFTGVDICACRLGGTEEGAGLQLVGLDLSFELGEDEITGCQLGGFLSSAVHGAQIGAITYNLYDPSISLSRNHWKLIRGCLNLGVLNLKLKEGFQVGAFNHTSDGNPVQIGLFNTTSKGSPFQIGLLNINPNGFFPIFPFFNYSIKKTP